MYIASIRIFNNKNVAIASSLIYLCNVYRVESYYTIIRLGEIQAFVFIPLLILSLYEVLFGDNKKSWLLILSSSLIYQSHMISTYLYFILFLVIVIIYIIKIRDIGRLKLLFSTAIVILLLNCWYFIPQLYEMLFVDFYNPMYLDGYLQFKDAININTFISSNLSFVIIILISIIFFTVLVLFKFLNKKIYEKMIVCFTNVSKLKVAIYFMIIGIFFQFLIFDFVPLEKLLSTFLAKFLYVLQFRTRFNLISIPFISLGFPFVFKNIFDLICNCFNIKILKNIIYIFIVTMISTFSGIIFMNNYWKNPNMTSQLLPTWNLDYFLNGISSGKDFDYNNDILLSSNDIQIDLKNNGEFTNRTNISFDYYVEDYKDKSILLPLYSYPVYKVVDENGNKVETRDGYNRLIAIELKKSKGSFAVSQYEPPLWLFGDIISLLTLFGIVAFFINKFVQLKLKRL